MRVHAAPGISDGDAQVIARVHFGLSGQIGADGNRPGGHVQQSSLFSHGPRRIGAQIQDDLMHLRGVGRNRGQFSREVRADGDARGHQPLGVRGTNVIFRQHLEQARARHARQQRGIQQRQRGARQDQAVQAGEDALRQRHIALGRKPAEGEREHVDEQKRDHEHR